jgi:hypothetical protein
MTLGFATRRYNNVEDQKGSSHVIVSGVNTACKEQLEGLTVTVILTGHSNGLHEPAIQMIDQADTAEVAKSIRNQQTLFGSLSFV